MVEKYNVNFIENILFIVSHYFNIELTTTYKVNVATSDEWGSGTNANVYIIIFSEYNNTGMMNLLNKIKQEKYF
jgi:hypothetical protein